MHRHWIRGYILDNVCAFLGKKVSMEVVLNTQRNSDHIPAIRSPVRIKKLRSVKLLT